MSNIWICSSFNHSLPPTPLVFSFKWFRMQWIIRKFLCDLACRVLIRPDQESRTETSRVLLFRFQKGKNVQLCELGLAPTHTYQRAPPPALSPSTPLLMPACLAPYKAEPSKRHFKFRGAKKKNKKVGQNFRFSIFFIHFDWGYYECEGNINVFSDIYLSYIFLKSKIEIVISLFFSNSKWGKRRLNKTYDFPYFVLTLAGDILNMSKGIYIYMYIYIRITYMFF